MDLTPNPIFAMNRKHSFLSFSGYAAFLFAFQLLLSASLSANPPAPPVPSSPKGSDSAAPELFPFEASAENLNSFLNAPVSSRPAGADGLIRVENEHFVNDAGIVRFWGVNVCMGGCFPEKETASAMARRIASFGLNIVRLHHMDMREIWGKNYPRQTEFDPEKLDRLDWFIAELKRNGVYVNINLHVSRKFTPEDGFPGYDQRPNHDKGLDHFMPRMIELQKKFARDLLTHVNPYTGLSYCEDPCVAMVEINNENSTVSQWRSGAIDSLLPDYCEAELQKQWNEWLRKKYLPNENADLKEANARLRNAWNCQNVPIGQNMIPNASFDSSRNPWTLSLNGGARGTLAIENGTLVFNPQKIGENPWEPQFFFLGLALKGGKPYSVKFRARSDKPQKVALASVKMDSPWTNQGLHQQIELTPEWREFSFVFIPPKDEPCARIGISHVAPETTLEFDDFIFAEGGKNGPDDDKSLERGNIPIPKRLSTEETTVEMREDFTRFMIELEREYSAEMFDFVKNTLKCRHPVTGTQLNYGSAYPQAKMDYVDNHSYWNHPHFPGRPWDGNDWYVSNHPLVNIFGYSGTIAALTGERILGKPYTVSEYNHPYPNLYFAEGFPMIAAQAAYQDWAGVFIFGWTHSPFNPNRASFFDIHGNAPALVHQPACFNLFVRGDVKSGLTNALRVGNANIVELPLQKEIQALCDCCARNNWNAFNHELQAPSAYALAEYSGTRLTDLGSKNFEKETGSLKPLCESGFHERLKEKPLTAACSTREILWNAELEKKGYLIIDTPKTKVFTGFIAGRKFRFADGTEILPGKTILDWMTLSITNVQAKKADKPQRWLLVATGLVRNTNEKIRIYQKDDLFKEKAEIPDTPTEKLHELIDQKITTCRTNGEGPNQCEGISAKIMLPAPKGVNVKFFPLSGTCERKMVLNAKRISDSTVEIELSPKYQTLWYEIEFVEN